ncbi:hypothetical protein ACSBR1_007192 [Camellia fascicularis]
MKCIRERERERETEREPKDTDRETTCELKKEEEKRSKEEERRTYLNLGFNWFVTLLSFNRRKLLKSLVYQCNFNVSGCGQSAKITHTIQIAR